jgi:glycerol-3-phosphate dehydrogenase (NAD(P)+)
MTEVLLAVPSVGFRSTLVLMKPLLSSHAKLICATKGLEDGTGRLCHEMANEVLGGQYSFAALSGPSFAKEVAAGLPTAVAIASTDAGWIKVIAARFRSAIFQTHACEDVTGVEIAAVVKNVIAIATGMSDGMKLGANARSALITFGLNEMTCLGLAIGAKKDTFMGLAGVGDLILTCSDDQSRNRRLGLALGHGKSIADAEKEIGQVVEGKRNAEIVVKLASEHQVSMPTCSLVWDILQGKVMLQDVKERFLQTTG